MKNQNNLINEKTNYINAIGLNTLILLSKDLFPNNEDIKQYTINNFNLEIKDYLFKNRTMLVARTNRYIHGLNDEELNKLYSYMNNYINNKNIVEQEHRATKRNKSKDNLKTWLENI